MKRAYVSSGLAVLFLTLAACGDDGGSEGSGGGTPSTTSATSATTGSGTLDTSSSAGGASGTGGDTSTSATGMGGDATGSTTGSGGSTPVADPNVDGPYTSTIATANVTVAATGSTFGVKAWIPSAGPDAGPYPLVIVAHGFQLPSTQYEGYAERLASFGYVAVTAEYPTGFTANHLKNAKDLVGVIDWASTASQLMGKVDVQKSITLGHSLGGKASLLAATLDPRIVASVGLDPVDSAMFCNPTDCPDMSNLMGSLSIPTLLIGETLDATAGGFGQACAPAADNYQTFYANAVSPSFEVTALGANHMSFLDDAASCGLPCFACKMATADNATVNGMARAFATAFVERHVRGITGYDAYLTGSEAQARYVTTNLATIQSK